MKKNTKTCIFNKKSDEGFALILTLWVLMIMSVLILTYSMSVNTNIKNASYLKDKIQASAYAEGVLYLIAVDLIPPDDKKDKKNSNKDDAEKSSNSKSEDEKGNSDTNKTDSTTEGNDSNTDSKTTEKVDPKQVEWFFKKLGKRYIHPKTWAISKNKIDNSNAYANGTLNNVTLVCEIYAEDAKFPLNKLAQFKELPPGTDISPVVLSTIKDYLKKIKDEQASSKTNSEKGTSQNQNQSQSSDSTKTKDNYGSFSCVAQLLEIENIEDDVYDGSTEKQGLKDIMTVFSDGKIYVNKANEQVLALVPGISSGAAGQMASQVATENYLKSFDDLNSMIGANSADTSKAKKWLTLLPKYFRIKAKATVYGITSTAECVVKIEKNNINFVLMNRG